MLQLHKTLKRWRTIKCPSGQTHPNQTKQLIIKKFHLLSEAPYTDKGGLVDLVTFVEFAVSAKNAREGLQRS